MTEWPTVTPRFHVQWRLSRIRDPWWMYWLRDQHPIARMLVSTVPLSHFRTVGRPALVVGERLQRMVSMKALEWVLKRS